MVPDVGAHWTVGWELSNHFHCVATIPDKLVSRDESVSVLEAGEFRDFGNLRDRFVALAKASPVLG